MSKKKNDPVRGFLDYLDITIGRVSDSDSNSPGKRKRSWGATVMFFCMIPATTLVFAVAFNIVIASMSIRKSVPAPASVSSKAAPKKRRAKVVVSKPLNFPKPISVEWPIVGLASLILIVGVSFSLFRRKQDLDRAIQLGRMVSEVKHGIQETVKELPEKVKTMYESANAKIGDESDDH